MAFIYKITNDINEKVYIGKTLGSLEKRWREHQKDCKNRKREKRPLYSAINKYGIEHFKIESIEECANDIASEREIYWIAHFNSFKSGYNATKGGDGIAYVDSNVIAILWLFNKCIKEIHEITGYSESSIRKCLYSLGVTKISTLNRGRKKLYRPVSMYSKEGKFLKSFSSVAEAVNYIKLKYNCKISGGGHIPCACSGKRATAYGYIWKYE